MVLAVACLIVGYHSPPPLTLSVRLSDQVQLIPIMHRLRSHSTLRRFRISSLLLVLTFLAVPLALGSVCYSLVSGKHEWFGVAGWVVVSGIICMTLNFMISGRLRCPLCMVPPLQGRRCAKHNSAERLLGSHRLRVAQTILFKGCFRCPYCGEFTAMQVRERGGR